MPGHGVPHPTLRLACVTRRHACVDVGNRVADTPHRVRILVRDLDVERLLKRQQQLERIQRVGPKVVAEAGGVGDGVLIDAEMLRR